MTCVRKVVTALVSVPVTAETTAQGFIVRGNNQWGEMSNSEEDDGLAVSKHARSMQLSLRQMLKMPRLCTRATLDRVRGDLTPYKANPCVVQGASISKRSAGMTSLFDVVTTQISLVEQCGILDVATPPIQVILCRDATTLWRTSATRCDIFVDSWGDINAATDPRRWVTWWALDGSDDAGCLRGMDRCAGLSDQVKALQEQCDVLVNGLTQRFHVFLTSDGK